MLRDFSRDLARGTSIRRSPAPGRLLIEHHVHQLLVLAAQEVVDMMLDEESTSVAELEEFISKTIKFQVESLYTQEQYDVVLM